MEFDFSKLQEAAAELAQKAAQGVSYVAQKGRETYDRLALENELHKAQRRLGVYYYDQARMGADHRVAMEECLTEIDGLLDRLEEMEDTSAAKTEEKGPCCTGCGAACEPGAMFCAQCGTKR